MKLSQLAQLNQQTLTNSSCCAKVAGSDQCTAKQMRLEDHIFPHTNTTILLEPYCGTITEPGLPMNML